MDVGHLNNKVLDCSIGAPTSMVDKPITRFRSGMYVQEITGTELAVALHEHAIGPDKAAGFDAVLQQINIGLESIERCPLSWGGPEALEMQMLLMVELRQRLLRPRASVANRHETRRAYISWIASVYGEPNSRFLHDLLREHDALDQLPKLLADFARWIMTQYPPEHDRILDTFGADITDGGECEKSKKA